VINTNTITMGSATMTFALSQIQLTGGTSLSASGAISTSAGLTVGGTATFNGQMTAQFGTTFTGARTPNANTANRVNDIMNWLAQNFTNVSNATTSA
jgi:hypothetical protein